MAARLVHQSLARAVLYDANRRLASAVRRIGDRRIERRESLQRSHCQSVEPAFLVLSPHHELPKSRQTLHGSQARAAVRLEKYGIAREQKSALASLAVEQRCQYGGGRFENVARMRDAFTRGEGAAQGAKREHAAHDHDDRRSEYRDAAAETAPTRSRLSR